MATPPSPDDPPVTAPSARLGEATRGVWTRAAALDVLPPGQVRGHLLDGDWWCPWPGVCADGGVLLDAVGWAAAAVLATLPRTRRTIGSEADVVACGRTAARVLGIPLIDDHDPATGARDEQQHDVSSRRNLGALESRPLGEAPVQLLHRYQLTLTAEDVLWVDGVPVTSYERTLVDLTGLISHEALVCAIDWCLHHGHVTLEGLAARVAQRKGRHHAPAFGVAVAAADARAESCAETLARLVLLPVLPGLVPQVEVLDRSGRVVARLDLADPELMLAVEPDGKRFHAGEEMVAKDRRRDALTGDEHGWWTERVTWFELRRRQVALRARVLARADRLRARADRTAA